MKFSNLLQSGFEFSEHEYELRLKYILFNSLIACNASLVAIAGMLRITAGDNLQGAVDFTYVAVAIFIALIARQSKKIFPAMVLAVMLLSLIVVAVTYQSLSSDMAGISWFLILILVTSYLTDKKTAGAIFFLSLLVIIFVSSMMEVKDYTVTDIIYGVLPLLVALLFAQFYETKNTLSREKQRIINRILQREVQHTTTKLSATELRYGLLADYTFDWEYWINPEGQYEYLSPSCEKISGYKANEFKSNPPLLFDITSQEHVEMVRHHYKCDLNEKTPSSSMEFKILTKGGEERWLQHNCIPVFDDEGNYLGRRGNNRDITARKQAEAERERLLQAIDQSSETILITDTKGTIQYVNPAYERITGYTHEETIGQNPSILKSDKQDENTYRKMWETLAHGEIWRGRFINRKKDGTLFTEEATISPVRDASGKTVNYVAVKRDITAEIKAEEKRQELEIQLNQKHKMEALGIMAGGISHDFNNNLAIILGNIELALRAPLPEGKAASRLEDAKIATLRARDLVRQILVYSRQGAPNLKPVQIDVIIDETLKLLRSTIPASVKIKKTMADHSQNIIIYADSTQLQEILINFCNNAAHAMEYQGEIDILLDLVDVTQTDIPVHYQRTAGRYAKLSVEDTGSGIAPDILEKVFDPFYTTKEVGKGTGMGLAIVHGIIDTHGGFVSVRSTLGKGSTFEVYFPLPEGVEIEETTDNTDLPRGTERILLLDDEEMLARMEGAILTQQGYHVTVETCSINALKIFKKNPEQFDLVITDQTMPELCGDDFIKKILAIRPDLLTILCTGYSNKIHATEAEQIGIKAFCIKPLNLPQLVQTVRQVLDAD